VEARVQFLIGRLRGKNWPMPSVRWRRIGGAALAALAVVAVLVGASWQGLARAAIVGGLAWAAGLHASFGHLEVHPDRLVATGMHVENSAHEPIADIERLTLRYSLRDLLPGSSRMFGLVGFDVENAHLIVTRHRDGTLNIPLPRQQMTGPPPSTPYVFSGRLRNASADVYDLAHGAGPAHHLMFRNIAADLDVATNARTRYRVVLKYMEDLRTFPLYGNGYVSVADGVGMQRWWTSSMPIGRIVNVALNSPALRMQTGWLRNGDARIIGVPGPDGALTQYASATAHIDGVRLAIGGLSKPLRSVNGPIAVYGDGLLLENLSATLAGVPIRVGGGIFGLTSPRARLTVTGRGDLRNLRSALLQTERLPLRGPVKLSVTVEGVASKPLVLIALWSPRAAYGAFAFDRTKSLMAFDGRELDVVDFRARYGNIGLVSHGRLNLHPQSRAVEVLAGLDVPADALPYVNAIGPIPLHTTALATGDRPRNVDACGVIFGKGAGRTVAGTFDLHSNGTGIVGPLRIDAPRQSLFAIASLNRPRAALDAYVDASNVHLASAGEPVLPGLALPSPPKFSATIDSRVAGHLQTGHLALAGFANLRDVRIRGENVARAHVVFGRTPQTPLAVAMDASGIGRLGASATAMVSYDNGTLHVTDAAAATRGSFVDARGSVTGVQRGTARYDLWTNLHTVDLASLAAIAQPRAIGLVEGSAEARLHVWGSGAAPTFAGTLALPEGAANGLAFHNLSTSVRGTPASVTLGNGSVGIGSTNVAFDGVLGASSQRLSIASAHADLADFNDFFDAGDVLGGVGHLRADVELTRGSIVATNGDVGLHNAKLRGFDIGAASGSWHSAGDRIDTTLAFGGPSGRVSATGSVSLTGSGVDLTAHARDVDLARWLPMAGIVAPVTGLAQADITAAGRYPDFDSHVSARVADASVGRVPVARFSIAATTSKGRGRVSSSTLLVANARVDGSGTFGLRPGDPLDLTFHATTPNVAALGSTLTGKRFDAAGSLDTTIRVGGTLSRPALADDFTLTAAHYGTFDVPRAIGHVRADERSVTVSSSEIDLQKGRVEAHGRLPIRLIPFDIDPTNRPVSATLIADDVEASNLAGLLPKGTNLGGRVDGRVNLSGTVRAPKLGGTMTFAKGYLSGPVERVPITDAAAQLVFSGTSARLIGARANAGGGTIDADGTASIPDVGDMARASMALNLHARNARLDFPEYIKGRLNADLQLNHAPGAPPELGGTVSIDSARIPMTALYNPKASSAAPLKPPAIGMDMHIRVNRDVRVVSPNVDVGTQGALHVMGTLAAPQLAGTFTSTGGTVNFFREFTIENAVVSFDPSSGVIPDVDAAATTFVTSPDTNIALRVTGPATHLNLELASDPTYDREQILGLLANAQSLGAVHGVQTSGSSPFSTSSAVSNLAMGQLNTIFTRNLLEPLSVAIGGSLGLQNLQITNDVQSGLGLNAVKAFGKNVNFIFADTFNEPRRESWSLQAHPSDRTQFELTVYSSQETSFGYQPFLVQRLDMGNAATIPLDTGTNGVDLKVQRKFP
jgi:hypothetical protein